MYVNTIYKDGIDHYSSRYMFDPNFMALALTVLMSLSDNGTVSTHRNTYNL